MHDLVSLVYVCIQLFFPGGIFDTGCIKKNFTKYLSKTVIDRVVGNTAPSPTTGYAEDEMTHLEKDSLENLLSYQIQQNYAIKGTCIIN
jgi:hypothetical protein